MRVPVQHSLELAIRAFVSAHRDADVVEAVVDSSVNGPCLNLWAWRIHQGKNFDDAMQEVARTHDWGFLADIVDELGSTTLEIARQGIYPHWPDAIGQGDQTLIQLLDTAASELPAGTPFLFHHVDAWPAAAIRAGVG